MNDNQHPVESSEPGHDPATPAAGFSARRRRLLRIAGGAAPASLMLVGRPVHATYNCVSTSAWGSAMVSASATASSSHTTPIDCWSLQHWCDNSYYSTFGKPWDTLCKKLGKFYSNGVCDVTNARKSIKLSGCGISVYPAGLTSDNNLSDALLGKCTGSNDFNRSILVAQLNQFLLASSSLSPTRCAPAPDINTMAKGSFQLGGGKSWGKSEITDYVKKNYLSRPN
ncbi:MAG: hypothetical protein QM702_19480 [Rubrivivax sp.]